MTCHPDIACLCSSVPEHVRPLVTELAENVSFMAGKLRETRVGLAHQQVVIPYDNGGGQKGIRRNPAFEGYNQLLGCYRKSLDQLMAILRDNGADDASDGDNPLAQILAEAEAVLAGEG